MTKRRTTANGATGEQLAGDPVDRPGTWDSDDPEIRALSRNQAFRELLRRSAQSAELARQTEEEEAARLAAPRRNGGEGSAARGTAKAPAKAGG